MLSTPQAKLVAAGGSNRLPADYGERSGGLVAHRASRPDPAPLGEDDLVTVRRAPAPLAADIKTFLQHRVRVRLAPRRSPCYRPRPNPSPRSAVASRSPVPLRKWERAER